MEIYEPELMYALDSLNEYSDWKNVYNVSGNDICYCPICLGRVKLWNGQDPNKIYLKQRCFHHIEIEDYLNSHTNENVENSLYNFIISELEKEMNNMLKHALVGKSTVRLLEVK